MPVIHRYILRQLATALVFVTVALTGVIWLTQSLRFVELIVNRGLSATTFMYLTMLLLPGYLVLILPIGVFAATLFVYNKITMDSELVALRAAGVSHPSLARPAIVLAIATAVICYALTLYLQPTGYRQFKDLLFTIRHSAVLLQEGRFNSVAPGLTVYVRARQANGELQGILIHDNRTADRPVTMMAERGALVHSPSGPRVVLVQGNRQETGQQRGRLSLLYFDRYTVDLGGFRESVQSRWHEPRERYVHELFSVSPADVGASNVTKFRSEGHQRLLSPLYAMGFGLIAVVTMLLAGFSRRGQPGRVIAAIGIALVVQMSALGFTNLAAKSSALLPFMYANAFLCIGVPIYVLLRWSRARGRTAMAPEH